MAAKRVINLQSEHLLLLGLKWKRETLSSIKHKEHHYFPTLLIGYWTANLGGHGSFKSISTASLDIEFFSCEDAALQVLMSVCVSVCGQLVILPIPRLPRVTQGCPGLPKVSIGCTRLPEVAQGCTRLPKVTYGLKECHDLACCIPCTMILPTLSIYKIFGHLVRAINIK